MDPPQNILYYDSYSLLVINPKGKIRRVYTPFKVHCIEPVDDLQFNSRLIVDEVFEDQEDKLLYKICGNLYAYQHFEITIQF